MTILSRREIQRVQRALDARYYRQPDPMASYEQWREYAHADLRSMSLSELLREQQRLRGRLLFDPHPRPWFLQRARAIAAALSRGR